REPCLEALALSARVEREVELRQLIAPGALERPGDLDGDRTPYRRIAADVASQIHVGLAASDVVRTGEGLSEQRLGVSRAAAGTAACTVASAAGCERERQDRERQQRDDRTGPVLDEPMGEKHLQISLC